MTTILACLLTAAVFATALVLFALMRSAQLGADERARGECED